MAYEQKPGRGQTPFGEVLESKGLINVIKNPKRAIEEAKQIKVDRLKNELASKPSGDNVVYTMERLKPEGQKTSQYFKVGREGNRTGNIVSKELNLDYTRKMGNVAAKARGEKSMWRQMRDEIKQTKPSFKGKGVSDRLKAKWKDKEGGTGGVKNKIKNRYGFGFVNIIDEPSGTTGERAPGAGSNQSFCTAKGGCKQVNP
jgi:hypothetical protein